MFTLSQKTFLFGLLVFSEMTFAGLTPITIKEITASGTACPEGTYTITLAPDQRSFSVLFDQALVASDNQNPLANKVCELTIVSQVPAGWKFNLHGMDYRGFSQVDRGSRTLQRTLYYRLNPNNQWLKFKSTKKLFKPEFSDNYTISHLFKLTQPKSFRCVDHVEVIKVQVQLNSQSKQKMLTSAQLALDSFDGSVEGEREICGF